MPTGRRTRNWRHNTTWYLRIQGKCFRPYVHSWRCWWKLFPSCSWSSGTDAHILLLLPYILNGFIFYQYTLYIGHEWIILKFLIAKLYLYCLLIGRMWVRNLPSASELLLKYGYWCAVILTLFLFFYIYFNIVGKICNFPMYLINWPRKLCVFQGNVREWNNFKIQCVKVLRGNLAPVHCKYK